ncbi:phosphodiester glycosidase family protein [Sphingomonas sp. GCM10030256]|uniref:phosphodiester glycosidase family protein n=1 Tax=Sphingomonas sp. GCM10030256 TaxID=3273427 RepID=UPI003608C17C
MRLVVVLLLLLLSSCRQGEVEPSGELSAAEGVCRSIMFEESRFTACKPANARLELYAAGADDPPLRSFAALGAALGGRAEDVQFAMNAGMFDEEGRPIGLAVSSGKEVHRINRRRGTGNFHLMPNGVFLVRGDGSAAVVPTSDYRGEDVVLASQSGPLLLINGKLHPRFEADGESRYARNGVGVDRGGTPVFVISDDAVSFGKLARVLRDEFNSVDALYFDGSVSSLWDPANNRMDSFAPLGPMIVAVEQNPASSGGQRGG